MTTATKTGVPPAELLFRRLSAIHPLKPEDFAPASQLEVDLRSHAASSELRSGEADEIRLVCAGFVGELRLLSDGRRQILGLKVPGDFVRLPATSSAGHVTLALSRAQTVDAAPFLGAIASGRAPAVRAALAKAERADAAAMLDHVLRLGRLTAYERTAHLLLELHERLLRVGLAMTGSLELPLTQEILADLLGLSIVHVNRTLQQLRRDGLIQYRLGRITLFDRAKLAQIANYELRVPPPARTTPVVRRLSAQPK